MSYRVWCDKELAAKIVAALQAGLGITCFHDVVCLNKGEDWEVRPGAESRTYQLSSNQPWMLLSFDSLGVFLYTRVI